MSISQGLCSSHDLIILNFEAKNKQQVIKELGNRVLQKGFITTDFIESVLKREDEFPTGLEFEIPIAIPHIGEHCNQSFLSFAILQKPVGFLPMDGSDKELPVEIVFLFGITNPQDQVEVLKKIIFAFRDGANLKRLKESKGATQAFEILNDMLDNCLKPAM